ncbi:MAG: HAD-IIIA family hydrolase [Bacteroidia bacterium]|nr:HAD-IIIA family hydrolase [Bacteroidia bacterium]
MNSLKFSIKTDSALFIDRDGVINKLLPNDYVKQCSEFILLSWVSKSFEILRPMFNRIFIVTNQQGIGKNLMIENIETIHEYFLNQLNKNIRPDKIYHCPHLKAEMCVCRKPKPGMALMAKNDFPEINLKNSIMIGDSQSDIEFAINCGMIPVLISDETEKNGSTEYFTVKNLLNFAEYLVENKH